MIKVRLYADMKFILWVMQIAADVIEECRQSPALDIEAPEADPELARIWLDQLREELDEDCEALMETLSDGIMNQQEMAIEEAKAEAMLRASSAIRLKLRRTGLAELSDSELETADVAPEELSIKAHRAYIAYRYFALLQSAIINALDPSLEDDLY